MVLREMASMQKEGGRGAEEIERGRGAEDIEGGRGAEEIEGGKVGSVEVMSVSYMMLALAVRSGK